MHGMLNDILHYVQNAARFKWGALVFTWLVCLGGWTYVAQMPDVFKATTRVHVDTRSILRPLLQGMTIQPDIGSQIRLMTRLIFTRPNIEKIAKMTDLDLEAKDEKGMEKLVERLQKAMVIEGGDSNLFTIGVTDADPKVAKKVVQAVLTLFVEQSLGESREDSDATQKFLEQQIKEHELRLKSAEQAREDFKRENYGLIVGGTGGGDNLYTQLNELASQKEQAKWQAEEAVKRRDEIQRQLENEEPMVRSAEGGGPLSAASPIDQRILNLRSKLDELLLRYTDKHPAVVTLKKSIADLEKQKKAEDAAVGTPDTSAPAKGMEPNPIYQQLKIALGEAEANIVSLAAREKAYDDKIEMLKRQMDDRLKVETHLQGLNRDYDTVKANYNELLKKRETAKMSGSVEQTTDAVKFRVVDPPQVPSKPSAPNRILLYSIVLGASAALGLGLSILLSLLRPSFGTIQGLRDVTGLPVLGSISMNWIPDVKKQKRRELVQFLSCLAALLFLFLGVILLEIKGINLQHFSV